MLKKWKLVSRLAKEADRKLYVGEIARVGYFYMKEIRCRPKTDQINEETKAAQLFAVKVLFDEMGFALQEAVGNRINLPDSHDLLPMVGIFGFDWPRPDMTPQVKEIFDVQISLYYFIAICSLALFMIDKINIEKINQVGVFIIKQLFFRVCSILNLDPVDSTAHWGMVFKKREELHRSK